MSEKPENHLLRRRPPTEYNGEPVCPRCGSGWVGCVNSGYTHAETCDIYNWSGICCDICDDELEHQNRLDLLLNEME